MLLNHKTHEILIFSSLGIFLNMK
uniref:Uncharacterized protein n=1 Tax=Anguilla anguilla TaxID=7936 RepID=A0A0E9S1I1_ANGAN